MAAERGAAAEHEVLPTAGFLLLAGITLAWGVNWPAMKFALGEIPVWTFRTICLLGGGLGLLGVARLMGQSLRVPRDELRGLLICALFNVVGWHLFSGYGVSLIEAGRAAIIAFTMPIWAAILGTWVLGERLTGRRLIGLAFGLVGLGVLIGPDLAVLGKAPLGALFMLGAAMSWGAGTVALKRFAWTTPTTVLAAWQLLAGALPISIGMVLIDGLPDPSDYSGVAWLATAYAVLLPMIFCHWAYFTVVRLFPATIAAIGTLAIPVVGVLSSAVMLGEPAGIREFSALFLVCLGLGVVLLRPRAAAPGGT